MDFTLPRLDYAYDALEPYLLGRNPQVQLLELGWFFVLGVFFAVSTVFF